MSTTATLNMKVHVARKAKIRNRYNSSTIAEPGHHMEKWQNTIKYNIQESQVISPFLAGDHKAARDRQDSIIKTNMNHE